MIENVLKRADARRYWISQYELERRWKAVRERMAAKKIDYLVLQSQQRFVGGPFRWLTDLPGENFVTTVVFPQDDDMTIIAHGQSVPAPPANPPEWALRGIKERINIPSIPTVWWEDGWHAEKAVAVMMRNKPKTVGLVGLGNMSAALYENLKKGLQGVNIINATDLVDEVRMVKSEEELNLHRDAAYMHQMSYEAAKKAIRPGRTAMDVIVELRYAQLLAGCEEQQLNMGFGRVGSTLYRQHSWGNTYWRRTLQQGDAVNLLIEFSSPGGYWYDLRRFLCLGPVPKELEEAYAIAKEAREIMANHCKPGMMAGEALEASDKFLMSKGCPPETRVAGHGQGVDLVERPILHPSDTAKLEVGMVISLHPTAHTKYAMAGLADTYVITESGAVPLYKNLFDDDEIAVIG